jgi:hypothetical protein
MFSTSKVAQVGEGTIARAWANPMKQSLVPVASMACLPLFRNRMKTKNRPRHIPEKGTTLLILPRVDTASGTGLC